MGPVLHLKKKPRSTASFLEKFGDIYIYVYNIYIYIRIYIYIHLEINWPLFLKVNPPKQGLFQSKQWSFGIRGVYIYIYINLTL